MYIEAIIIMILFAIIPFSKKIMSIIDKPFQIMWYLSPTNAPLERMFGKHIRMWVLKGIFWGVSFIILLFVLGILR